ncbi:energy-coupling factor transporter transmembrane protein EcfT [Donghicola sp. XS_ASV15]|uniref:energy-coupling factor transporter transmembrane component T family protein n=1 Tax=Donghicola sp. XS_ASV15 TaxID=3241295 RepID=UPI00351716DC
MISLTSPVEIWAHRVPAGLKLAVLSLATMVLFAIDSPIWQGAALCGAAALVCSGGWRFAAANLHSLRVLWPFLLLLAVWHGATGQVSEGAVVALRLLTALMLANFVTMTSRLSDMVAVVSFLTAPLRKLGLPTRALELSIALVIRFTPAIAQKGAQLSEAWQARSTRRSRWQIVMPLAASALDDAEHVSEALRARGGIAATQK